MPYNKPYDGRSSREIAEEKIAKGEWNKGGTGRDVYNAGKSVVKKAVGVVDDLTKARTEGQYAGVDPDGALRREADRAGYAAAQARGGAGALGFEGDQEREYLRAIARGEQSVSAEQLRQAMQQNLAQQRSMAAGARGGNQVMMARQAMQNAGQINAGLSGQQAVAGMQERQMAQKALQDAILRQRDQDIRAGLGYQDQAIGGLGQLEQFRTQRAGQMLGTPTQGENLFNAFRGGLETYVKSKTGKG